MALSYAVGAKQEGGSSPVSATPCTVLCWFWATIAADGGVALKLYDNANPTLNYFHVHFDDSRKMMATQRSVDVQATATHATTITNNNWRSAGALFVSNTSRFAIYNASLSPENTTSVTSFGAPDRLAIAIDTPAAVHIAELAVWNVALTQAEITAFNIGYCPLLIRPDSLRFYVPNVRNDGDRYGISLTDTGTIAVQPHPRVIYPSKRRLGYGVVPSSGYTLTADYVPVTVSGQSASLLAARKLTADHTSLTVSPQAASLEYGRLLVADHVAVAVSPQSASLLAARSLSADHVAVAVTPQDAALLAARRLIVDYIPITVSVQDVASPTITLTAETIIVTLTPQAAGLFAARRLPADAALLTVAPQSASLLASRRLVADHVSLSVTPQSAALRRIYELIAGHVSLAVTPQSAPLMATRRMAADYAQLTVSPQGIDLVGPGDRGRLRFSRLTIARSLTGSLRQKRR
jgi:hypothetical protein